VRHSALDAWAPRPMLGLFALFLVLPAVLHLGGYTYLGAEVMIWAIFALGYNLLLGGTGRRSTAAPLRPHQCCPGP